ncbi:MAG TPA: hypothetical protein VK420_20810 [Longimicrobium sp.]|nr:hypothetical protein [Longimicrobium sp.]
MIPDGLLNRLRTYPARYARAADALKAALADIQGLVLHSYIDQDAAFAFLRLGEPRAARDWLRSLLPDVSTAAPARHGDSRRLNIAFTVAGLRALGLTEEELGTFPVELREGMASRKHELGDAVDGWELGRNPEDLHLVLMLYAAPAELEDFLAAQQERWSLAGVTTVKIQRGARVRPRSGPTDGLPRDHFAFRDGIAQPVLAGFHEELTHRISELDQPVLPGELLLGYVNEYLELPDFPCVSAASDPEGLLPEAPGAENGKKGWRDLGHNGTYLVLRKLEQDVDAFRALTGAAPHGASPTGPTSGCPMKASAVPSSPPLDENPVAAKALGRRQDGTPLEPHDTGHRDPAPDYWLHRFTYRPRDPHGFGCPVGSHIRRANPRDDIPDAERTLRGERARKKAAERQRRDSLAVSRKHRIIRRGITYQDPDGRKGLLFIALNANIRRQFEFIQQAWLGGDFLVGKPDGRSVITVPGDPVRARLHVTRPIVEVRGGEYFFMPSIKALRYLASRAPGQPRVREEGETRHQGARVRLFHRLLAAVGAREG